MVDLFSRSSTNFFVQAIEAYISFVRLCDVLFLVTAKIIPTCLHKSMHLQCYCTHHFQNPYIFSSKLARRIISGLNLTHLIRIVQRQVFDIECAPNGIGLILAGRMKGHMKTRFVPKMNALSLRSFTNRIIDIGIISSSLGLVGVKVGTII